MGNRLSMNMDIQTAINRCIEDLSTSPNTKRSYGNGLDRFLDYLLSIGVKPGSSIRHLKVEHFIYFLSWLNQHYSKQTVGSYGSASRALFDWLVLAGIFKPDYNDALRMKMATQKSHRRHEDKLPRWPQKDDVEKMLEAVHKYEEDSPRRERNIALIELLATSGCRISEVTALNVEDVDLEMNSAVVMGKGSKERRIFFSQSTADALGEYWGKRKNSLAPANAAGQALAPVFARHDRGAGKEGSKRITTATARNVVKQIAELAGLNPSKFTPHYFRHAFAIRILSETNNLALAQDLLGHQDPKSTRVYAKIYPEELKALHQEIFH